MSMTTNKQALRQTAEKAQEHGVFNMDIHSETLLALLDELEDKDKLIDTLRQDKDKVIDVSKERISKLLSRVAELEASHSNLREAMAGIHNTITGGGAYTPLAAILTASKRAYEESAAAAGITTKGE
jgi:hypothetical protein